MQKSQLSTPLPPTCTRVPTGCGACNHDAWLWNWEWEACVIGSNDSLFRSEDSRNETKNLESCFRKIYCEACKEANNANVSLFLGHAASMSFAVLGRVRLKITLISLWLALTLILWTWTALYCILQPEKHLSQSLTRSCSPNDCGFSAWTPALYI